MTFEQYREKFGIKLNVQQEQAVVRADGHTLLLAVPGSGKTTVIVSRLGYMIKCLGIPESAILTLTYSVAACRDMKERYISYFGADNVPEFRTIHGICSIIIRKYEFMKGTSAFTLMGGEESENSLLSEVFLDICGQYPEPGQINELKTCITFMRNMMYETEKAREIFDVKYDICAVMEAYRQRKISRRLMDYDDQLEFAYKILRQYPQVLDYFRKKFIYINVDEAQDTSKLQHEIIGLLENGNLFMVGDEDQSIYGFRAAYPRALLDFDKKYPDAVVLYMEENFRSTGNIIKRASRLISNNRERRPKHMFTVKSDGEDIEILNFPARRNQYSAMCEIAGKIPNSKETTAILFRNNDSALPFIAAFEKHGIKYRYRESDCPFFENPGVCDILALLDAIYKNSSEGFMYVAKRLGCGFRENEIRNIASNMKRSNICAAIRECIAVEDERRIRTYELCDVMDRAVKIKPSESIILLCTATCFGRFLKLRMKDMDSKTGILSELAYDCKNYAEFDGKIRNLKDIAKKGRYPDDNCIILSTVHSSKGLEYDNVYITDVKDGEFPCVETPEHCLDSEKAILEEERRLFYVAVTRARKKVNIIRYAMEFDTGLCKKSAFVRELMRYDVSIYKNSVNNKTVIPTIMHPLRDRVDISEFIPGKKVIHKNYGIGIIVSCEGDKCRIDFENGIAKILSLSVASDAGVLNIAE